VSLVISTVVAVGVTGAVMAWLGPGEGSAEVGGSEAK
jgi:hypothetical protein